MNEQGTHEWKKERMGRFTASRIHELCKPKGLGKGGESYVIHVLTEILIGSYIDTPETFAMSWGTFHEPIARELYKKHLEPDVVEVGFKKYEQYGGASADGIVKGRKGIEIKCPHNEVNHTKALLIYSNKDLFDYNSAYYYQIQKNMLVWDLDKWDFVSYHPKFPDNLCLFSKEITRDKTAITLIKDRINQAVELLEKLKKLATS